MGERFGKFEIITKIATGGMAEIFLARQVGIEGFQKLIVIKKILPHLSTDKEFVNMFLDEARMAAQLNHPNIVQIYDLGVINESYFIAMEYVDGVDLSSILKRGREKKNFLRLGWILRIISQVCEGLHYAHTLKDTNGQPLGLIHRDITPENILLSFNGGVKITDFGIARARGRSTSTTSGTLKGKFPYMSYEMVKGFEIDARSDIFSLGVVMWEMLTYRRLFKRETEIASINAILNEEIPSPKKYFKNLPDEVESIVMKALERDRNKRFQSAREMGDAIEDFITKRRVNVKVSDLSDYLKTMFPEKDILSARDKLSSSKLQKIMDIKEHKSASNSLPVITLQKKCPMSEKETVVLPQPLGEDREKKAEGIGAGVGGKEKGSEELVSVSEIKSLSEVMEEMKTDVSASKVEQGEIEEEEKEIKKATNEIAKEVISERSSDVPVPRKKRGKILMFAGGVIILFVISGVVFFLFRSNGEKTSYSGIVSVRMKNEEKSTEAKSMGNEKLEENKNGEYVDNKPEQKSGSLPQDEKLGEIVKKEEQKVAVVDKPRVQDRKGELDKKKIKIEEKPKEEVQVASVEVKKGFISIDSDPWTEVYLEGKKLGETPLVRYELPVGVYNVVLRNSEFGFEKVLKLSVNPDENSVNKVRFGKGLLNITTNIPVEVKIGSNIIGKTPLSNIDLYEGVYKIMLFDPEYKKSKVIKIEIKEGKAVTINETL